MAKDEEGRAEVGISEKKPTDSNNFKMSGGAKIPFNIIDTALSSLKNSQSFISSGMDIATKTALDLVESFNDEEDVTSMEKVMLEFAAMDRDLNNYIRAFEETVNQVKREKPEIIPDLEKLVQEKLTAIESNNSDSDLKSNEKYMYFMDQLKEMKKQCKSDLKKKDSMNAKCVCKPLSPLGPRSFLKMFREEPQLLTLIRAPDSVTNHDTLLSQRAVVAVKPRRCCLDLGGKGVPTTPHGEPAPQMLRFWRE
ncbi:E3 SUMO-protein ligase NSE2-like [Empidonax traillii]|uniref:E3 SUMO-protein ligase NSE2-like n=1 Tax=Empidonax traillii TaxID=164674 RepID=UPI000FFD4313|nr:E3 SUMO-protein ligase NSE2-like [Empidonax traillii]